MRSFLNILINWSGMYFVLLLIACDENKMDHDIIPLANSNLEIIEANKDEIYSNIYHLDNPLELEQIAAKALDEGIQETEVEDNLLLYSLLSIAQNGRNKSQKMAASTILLNNYPDTANIKKSLLGELYLYRAKKQSDPTKKVNYSLIAASYFEQSYGSLNPIFMQLLHEIGSIYLDHLGDYDRAEKYINKSIQLLELNDSNDSTLVSAYRNMEYILMNKSELLKALCHANLANEIEELHSSNIDSFIPLGLINEALLLEQLKENKLAYHCYDSLLSYDEQWFDREDLALLLTNYANSLTYDQQYQKAEQYFTKALNILVKDDNNYIYTHAHYYNHLYEAGKYKKLLNQAKHFLNLAQDDKYALAYINTTIARAYENLGVLDSAFNYITDAWMIQANVKDEYHMHTVEELKDLFDNYAANEYIHLLRIKAKYYANKKDVQKLTTVLSEYDKLDEIFDYLLALGDEESQLHTIDQFAMIFSDALAGYYRLYEMEYVEKSKILYLFERSKSLLLRKNKRSADYSHALDDQSKKLKRKIDIEWQNLKMDYANYNNFRVLLKYLEEQSTLHQKQEKKIYEELGMKDIERVQNALKAKNQLLLSYYSYRGELFGISLYDTNFVFKHWRLEEQDYHLINELQKSISIEQANDKVSVTRFKHLSYSFYQKYVEPFTKNHKTSSWVIIRDGLLLNIPFEILLNQESQVNLYEDLNYLILEYELIYHYNISDYLAGQVSNKMDSKSIALFGYSDEETLKTNNENYYVELPGTLKETKQIMKILDVENTNMHLGNKCTKDQFLESVERADIIHLATHAISDPTGQRINKVIFRPSSNSIDSMDYILTSAEISGLEIESSLVFLSACETGKGKMYRGEGVFNLGRSFLSAGARHVIQSYWILDDFSASQIVAGFYINCFNGMNFHQALRASKMAYIKEWPTKSQPFFWCGVN